MDISEQMIKKSCSPMIYKRGLEYFREGRVHIKKREKNAVTAVVDGSELYHVHVKFESEKITDYFCTCPYYETMDCMCKHIVAVLKQRQTELEEGENFTDENDKLASALCGAYIAEKGVERIHLGFSLYISVSPKQEEPALFGISISAEGEQIRGVENFLAAVGAGKNFSISRGLAYKPGISFPGKAEQEILNILAESCQNRSIDDPLYVKSAYRTSFGALTAKRLLPLLAETELKIYFDGLLLPEARIINDDPDIIVDVEVISNEIDLSVSECGISLAPDGSWFFYEENIWGTGEEWRGWFMPIYRAVTAKKRTQLSFKGENTASFASCVLPHIQDKHGVVTRGIDRLITNEKPRFSVYLDAPGNSLTAVVRADYGMIPLTLPANAPAGDKIVVRDTARENAVLAHFAGFSSADGTFRTDDSEVIYTFLTEGLSAVEKLATVYFSQSFERIRTFAERPLSGHVSYRYDIDLLEADIDTDLSYDELRRIFAAIHLKKSFCRLNDGRFLNLKEPDGIYPVLAALDFSEEELKTRKKQLAPYQALYLNELSPDVFSRDSSFEEYIENIRSARATVPPALETVLRPYQREGLDWMKQLSVLGFGGILADDMGLGKTLEVIAYICGEAPEKPALIITPSALVYNWLAEIHRFAPQEKAVIIDGTKEERKNRLDNLSDERFVITSYPLLRRDIQLYRDIEFSYCFTDEAQYIKNPHTMSAKCAKKIRAGLRFALTGTPIENSLSELWSIFDFTAPGYLYTKKRFQELFEVPISRDPHDEAADILRAKIRPFVLRRMKADVLSELPDKLESTMFSELLPEQKKLYSAFLAATKKDVIELLFEGSFNRMRFLTILMRLRQICCHPKLFDDSYTGGSGKLELLEEILQSAVAAGHRILIFSQFTSMLALIEARLKAARLDYFYLDGRTPAYTRSEYADRFNGGERSVFLISLKAGGSGLNLTGADMVVHYDPWWNPAVMDQASDRAYRIGQTRAVQVIRLAAKGTIEEKILLLQEKKRSLADGVITANNVSPSQLTREDLIYLFEEQ